MPFPSYQGYVNLFSCIFAVIDIYVDQLAKSELFTVSYTFPPSFHAKFFGKNSLHTAPTSFSHKFRAGYKSFGILLHRFVCSPPLMYSFIQSLTYDVMDSWISFYNLDYDPIILYIFSWSNVPALAIKILSVESCVSLTYVNPDFNYFSWLALFLINKL